VEPNLDKIFQFALKHHKAGRLPEAEELYRSIVGIQPEHVDALFNLSEIMLQTKRTDSAIDLISRVISLTPGDAAAYNNLANALRQKGELDQSIAAYCRAISFNPTVPQFYNNLGNALKDRRQIDDAIEAYQQAISLDSQFPEAHFNLGLLFFEQGKLDEAIAESRRAIASRPNYAEAHNCLGNALLAKKQLDEAISACRTAVEIDPNYAEAFNNLGNALTQDKQFELGVAMCRRAIELRPDFADAYYNLGNALHAGDQRDVAVDAFRRALSLNPAFAAAYSNLALVLSEQGNLDEAIKLYRQAISLDPNLPDAHYNLSLALLARGDFDEGWIEYEWRWKVGGVPPKPIFQQPEWTGQPAEAATILLYTEQGYGDTLQSIRYVPAVAKLCRKVIIRCEPELKRLFEASFENCQIVHNTEPLPAFDFHCPLLTLPLIFKTTVATIPNQVPYLKPPPALIDAWRKRLNLVNRDLNVGLVWAGNPNFKGDAKRSLHLQQLSSLAKVAGVKFYSLQKGYAQEQAKSPLNGLQITNLGSTLADFADTAAVISLLDLVITTDTSVPHLAGALGRPTWTILQFVPHFCWFWNRDDSPWYPTARLFRQRSPGDWDEVIARVANELAALARG
jgi:tetratricopeptide (TPR) repeat protein